MRKYLILFITTVLLLHQSLYAQNKAIFLTAFASLYKTQDAVKWDYYSLATSSKYHEDWFNSGYCTGVRVNYMPNYISFGAEYEFAKPTIKLLDDNFAKQCLQHSVIANAMFSSLQAGSKGIGVDFRAFAGLSYRRANEMNPYFTRYTSTRELDSRWRGTTFGFTAGVTLPLSEAWAISLHCVFRTSSFKLHKFKLNEPYYQPIISGSSTNFASGLELDLTHRIYRKENIVDP